jgi:hypothetical protein
MSVKGLSSSAARKVGEERLAQFRSAGAAVLGQEKHQLPQRIELGALDHLSTLFRWGDQTCLYQHGQMRGEGALHKAGMFHQLSGRKTVGLVLHQHPKRCEPRRMRKGGQDGKGVISRHASGLFDAFACVKDPSAKAD